MCICSPQKVEGTVSTFEGGGPGGQRGFFTPLDIIQFLIWYTTYYKLEEKSDSQVDGNLKNEYTNQLEQ